VLFQHHLVVNNVVARKTSFNSRVDQLSNTMVIFEGHVMFSSQRSCLGPVLACSEGQQLRLAGGLLLWGGGCSC
jgi:hypothetical protein